MTCFQLLHEKRTALMVIDPQERLMSAVHKPEKVIRNISLMVRTSRLFNIPIVATTQYKKGIGPIVKDVEELFEGVSVFDKLEFDALANKDVRDAVKRLPRSVDTMLICGVEAHVCVHQTALSAARLGFRVCVLEDAISSRDKRSKKAAVQNFRALGFTVLPTETFVFELLKKAGTKEFKELLPFIK